MKINVLKNQFGFMSERSTMEDKYIVWMLIEGFREEKRYLCIIFIDLEKAYDKMSREIIWCFWRRNMFINNI